MKKILQKNEKVLRKVAKELPIHDIKTLKIRSVLREMSSALKSQSDGVAIAAPQIGYSLRIFVVAGKIFSKDFAKNRDKNKENRSLTQGNGAAPSPSKEETAQESTKKEKIKDLVFVNPVISKLSRDKEWMPEGCLSVRPLYGKTYRSKKVFITAHDENGKKFTRGASGLLAQIFQHETDHLNGILFIDHAKDVKAETI
ncbi:MAG: peptide deformylase [Candidatus Paceibacterota bacterium]